MLLMWLPYIVYAASMQMLMDSLPYSTSSDSGAASSSVDSKTSANDPHETWANAA